MFTVPAFAKINWSLRVLGRRGDGFHEICTTFQTVSLCDYLTFETAQSLSLSCDNRFVPTDESNLILRAANALLNRFSVRGGAKIHLQKQIPSPGGLGGGSADAAVTLLALNHLWQTKASLEELNSIAAGLGADVPFFLHGGTAFATGLGTEVEQLPDIVPQSLVIVTPNVNVSTAAAYQALAAPLLTELDSSSILTICRAARIIGSPSQTELINDFENTIFRLQPEIELAKNRLLESGAAAALMSGSGASVFGIFDKKAVRQEAIEKLRFVERDWRIFACETVSRAEYQKSLAPCWKSLRDSL